MKLNKKAVQKELDLAAEELERHGYVDLAHKVDQYNKKLVTSRSEDDIPTIRAGLISVEKESQRRLRAFDRKEIPDARKEKAKNALQRARRVAERKKALADRKEKRAKSRAKLRPRSSRLGKLLESRTASKGKSLREERLARLELAED